MKKQLITVDNLAEFCAPDGKLYLDGSKILTPGAKDELSRQHVEIVYGSNAPGACPPGCTCPACSGNAKPGLDSLMLGMAALLKTEYGVTDPEQLKALCLQAVKTIKENI